MTERVCLHPPNSPDLSPIEESWAEMKKQMWAEDAASWDEFVTRVKGLWAKQNLQHIKNRIDGMH